MSRGRFEPGAICVIIGEPAGYECNIGATITLATLLHGTNVHGEDISNWTFTEASRPLLIALGRNGATDLYGTDSTPFPVGFGVCVPAYAPRQLLPIGGEDLDNKKEEIAPVLINLDVVDQELV